MKQDLSGVAPIVDNDKVADMKEKDPTQETDTVIKSDNTSNEEPLEDQNPINQKKSNKTKKRILTGGIVIGVIAAIGIIVGILAANGVFDDNPCPAGEYRVCGTLGDGEVVCGCDNDPYVVLKPIIYLYPKDEIDVTVRLGAPERLTASYPKYIDGWNVTAYPNGDLVDKTNGNKLYSLYWEGERDASELDLTTGFVVKSEDTASFLEEKLEILGLNYREREEFIVYWLSKLEANKYNYVYFATEEEINREMPLEFSVQPDTIIRVRMMFKGLDEYEDIEEQVLEPAPERNGFTVIEWGGIELETSN